MLAPHVAFFAGVLAVAGIVSARDAPAPLRGGPVVVQFHTNDVTVHENMTASTNGVAIHPLADSDYNDLASSPPHIVNVSNVPPSDQPPGTEGLLP